MIIFGTKCSDPPSNGSSSSSMKPWEVCGGAYPDLAAEIVDIDQIIGFRHRLVHGYTTVNDRLVWATAEEELPALLATLTLILSREDPPQP
jgi:hypothetical protein